MNDDLVPQAFGGAWSVIKLDVLQRYLTAFTTALKARPFKLIYIDAFAGSGAMRTRADEGSGENVIHHGSAQRALHTRPPFHKLYFIEAKEKNVESLKKMVGSDERVRIYHGDANEHLQRLCSRAEWKSFRGVLFLDPFALSVDWATIECITRTRGLDVWYLFPMMAVTRLLPWDPDKRTEGNSAIVTRVLGTDKWRDRFYPQPEQKSDLFGPYTPRQMRTASIDEIENFVRERLNGAFAEVLSPKRLYGPSNQHLFSLFFAISNPKAIAIGRKIASHILTQSR